MTRGRLRWWKTSSAFFIDTSWLQIVEEEAKKVNEYQGSSAQILLETELMVAKPMTDHAPALRSFPMDQDQIQAQAESDKWRYSEDKSVHINQIPMADLAPDLFELIFNHLFADLDPKELASVLKSCCLASQKIKQIAEPRLLSLARYRHDSSRLISALRLSIRAWFNSGRNEDLFFDLLPNIQTLVLSDQFSVNLAVKLSETLSRIFQSSHLTTIHILGFKDPTNLDTLRLHSGARASALQNVLDRDLEE
ncbi:hypothetical protein BDN72DRAFT_859073 [Pluteus cervinus]|uniref:Uncharacterized protein n=1 Tax=Pluteus cervinus TaxID=181527 RepID=A0ACD3APW8_9AGAR|nr:hypothetical protein BDN72DRAFT_859073 [Pluteus cervinus]